MILGLYVHVPFCLQKCHYCDFVSYPYSYPLAEDYLKALELEAAYYARLFPELKINTLFIGGGTPTVLEERLLSILLDCLQRHLGWQQDAEVTVEANPDTLDLSKLTVLRRGGVNRLSLGVQACQRHLLQLLGRTHGYQEVVQAVEDARQVGFDNINLDLIFGIPGQTLDHWRQSLRLLTRLDPNHLACYGLQWEEGTPLTTALDKGRLKAVSQEEELDMYNEAIIFLTAQGYRHYEISSFAKPGYYSRHNLCYWHNGPYLGLGPAAHSHLNARRWANTADVELYVSQLAKGVAPVAESHPLSRQDSMIETAFMGLRLLEGINLKQFYKRFGLHLTDVWQQEVAELRADGLVELKDSHLRLTPKGLPLANLVFSKFV
ncbi:radical SAM family heme chaperone HemW [Desulfofalx alkaliphila]|uniref:radical SAM family heme chaperone HemW n=1 Tax=Desulfofalx alkaliphila TaxID=105483 RepID=UPI0004E1D602|nr:radical SAM family heme chaperone HemW [Desulfofalx alkaliphila]